jgi:TfoX/Sxy family transcriptional regulator of competence genes
VGGVASLLRDVQERKMFGCEALFTNSAIFALVWKTGRIAVKLPDPARFDALASEKGSEPWRAGEMIMSHWVLVPKRTETDTRKLSEWVREAHGMAGEKGNAKANANANANANAKVKARANAKAPAKAKAKARSGVKASERA